MHNSSPVTWLPGAVISQYIQFICPEGFGAVNNTQWRTLGLASYWAVYMLAMFWVNLVTKIVPEPYLDEIFHIPQAQLYCEGKYDYWDPKLTTPPGLYIFATLFTKIRYGESDVFGLRLFNATVLPITLLYALSCRHLTTTRLGAHLPVSPDSIHTALNIALFPPLFFFSGLFYTDPLSTCVVLVNYRIFLRGKNAGLWAIYPAGIVALTMRQTNIFWVAIFLGGLEAVRAISEKAVAKSTDQSAPTSLKHRLAFEIDRWGRGNIHDIPLSMAGVHDYFLCAISIAVAILHQPFRILSRLSPFIALLVSFGAFVSWNGGVVLGDKSNHVATIHLPQLLYLFAFTAFFSLPLLISPILGFIQSLIQLLRLPLFPRLKWQYLVTIACSGGALVLALLIIRYNTIIHPFTLADNRHYVFYAFRYTILRHPLIRYFLAPVYLVCGWAIYLTLRGSSLSQPSKFEAVASKISSNKRSGPPESPVKRADKKPHQDTTSNSEPKTSFLLIFLLTTALSLITAPLVEPRYFIIPWVIWRLHAPALPPQPIPSSPKPDPTRAKAQTDSPAGRGVLGWLKYWGYQGHDYRLWLETSYFLLINAVTGYVFLYRGFAWPQEPGKVQRFMW